ncbi:MAG: hypothetical protein JWL59_4353 [Chthoniobacteraceae bacterium]|nr:hypothetical protein [Chthoniobacteraceae bacterium]
MGPFRETHRRKLSVFPSLLNAQPEVLFSASIICAIKSSPSATAVRLSSKALSG